MMSDKLIYHPINLHFDDMLHLAEDDILRRQTWYVLFSCDKIRDRFY